MIKKKKKDLSGTCALVICEIDDFQALNLFLDNYRGASLIRDRPPPL